MSCADSEGKQEAGIMLRTNVLVIGGGPAGATTARFLAESGIDAILAERDLNYSKPCGGGIPSSAFLDLHIPDGLVKRKIAKILIMSPRGEDVAIELKGGYMGIVRREDFDPKLRKIAKDKGASVIEATFIRFEEIGKNIISLLRKKQTGEEIRIKSDYVVASDGITFRVGSALGIKQNILLYAITTHLKPAGFQPSGSSLQPLTDACEFWFGSQHARNFYSWIFHSNGYCTVGTGSANPKELTFLLDNFLKRRFNASLDDLRRENILSRTRAFRIPCWNGNLFNIKNILFTGDSAGMVMPVTYEGIYYAMKSGEFAARAIMEGKPAVYKKLWDSRFRNRFLMMSKIKNHFFKSDENIEKWVVLHKRADVQEIAMKLWLKKEQGSASLISYLKIFKNLLKG